MSNFIRVKVTSGSKLRSRTYLWGLSLEETPVKLLLPEVVLSSALLWG